MSGERAAPCTMTWSARRERWPLKFVARISGYTFTEIEVLTVTLRQGNYQGSGEASGVYYRNDSPAQMETQLKALQRDVERGVTRGALLEMLPPGGARNALDSALWDLEAKRQHRSVWEIVGVKAPQSLVTTHTIGADEPQQMAQTALALRGAQALKLKLTGDAVDAERVLAVRAARKDACLAVDANQGFSRSKLERLLPALVDAEVTMIEQPLPVGSESELQGLRSPIPIAADESAQTSADVASLVGRFDIVNIKLDKCGGLTSALEMLEVAREAGLKAMVGNMFGTSLAMAPAFVLGQLCDYVDLDGPLALASDRVPGVVYESGRIWCPPEIWGAP